LEDSNGVGEFDFALNNTSGQYSLIALPLSSTSITNAAGLANHIGNVSTLLKWNPNTQLFRVFTPPASGDNFSLVPGDAVYVSASDNTPSMTTFIGNVTTVQYTLVPRGYNFLSMPLQRPDLTNASNTAADVSNINTMLSWNESTQLFRVFVPPSSGDDFSLKPGTPFIINLGESGPTLWP
jgi:hypothetical protein